MKPPVYKTVTTKEGVMLFVDENAAILPNDICFNSIEIAEYENTLTRVITKKERPYLAKIVAQPTNSDLQGIPYYELTPQEEWVDVAELARLECPKNKQKTIRSYWKRGFVRGYKAAKAKEFTANDMRSIANFVMQYANPHLEWPVFLENLEKKISSLRQPMKVVSAEPIIDTEEYLKTNMNAWIDNPAYMQPETYEKDGKTFIRLNIKYE